MPAGAARRALDTLGHTVSAQREADARPCSLAEDYHWSGLVIVGSVPVLGTGDVGCTMYYSTTMRDRPLATSRSVIVHAGPLGTRADTGTRYS